MRANQQLIQKGRLQERCFLLVIAKGSALALMVEVLAAGLTGSNFGFEASSFLDAEGDSPGVGQLIIAIDPSFFSGRWFC